MNTKPSKMRSRSVELKGILFLFFSVLLLLLPLGAQDSSTAINRTCPVTPDEEIGDDAVFVTYKGQTVGLCCKRCRAKFLADPDQYVGRIPGFVTNKPQTEEGHQHGDATAVSEEPHDHSDHGGEGGVVALLGKFHPVVVHFPIALILVAALLELVAVLRHLAPYGGSARLLLRLGALSALVAMAFGFARASGDEQAGGLLDVFEWHRLLGVLTVVISVGALAVGERFCRGGFPRMGILYRGLVFGAAALVGVTGHLGGTLVFGLNYFF